MAEEYYCKYCGKKYSHLSELTSGNCLKSPTRKHVVFEGRTDGDFICKHCGKKYHHLSELTSGSCPKSPTKKHEPYEGF